MSKKSFKPKIYPITPQHIVDVWRLYEQSAKVQLGHYPDLTEEIPEETRHHLFAYILQPNFVGLILKKGRRPIGQILGEIQGRTIGRPKRYCFIWNFWIDPQFRKAGFIKLLYREYFDRLKKSGIFHWEANVAEELAKILIDHKSFKINKLYDHLGGKV